MLLFAFLMVEYQLLGYIRAPLDNPLSGFLMLFGVLHFLAGVFLLLYVKGSIGTGLGVIVIPAVLLFAGVVWLTSEVLVTNNLNLGRAIFFSISLALVVQSIRLRSANQ
jgi:hypothetical protein